MNTFSNRVLVAGKKYSLFISDIPVRQGEVGALCYYLILFLTVLALIKFPDLSQADTSGYIVWYVVYPLGLLLIVRDHYSYFFRK